MKPREIRRAIERVTDEAGATVSFQITGNLSHVKVTITYAGRSKCTHISGTPSDKDAVWAILADVRRTLRDLGYVKPVTQAKVEKPWRNRPPAAPSRRPERPTPRQRPKYRDEINSMTAPLRVLLPGYPWGRS